MSTQYPHDEFDDLPADIPVGVHRKPRSPWQTVLPFLLVLLVVPLLAWGATALIKGRSSETAAPVPAPTQSAQSLEDPQSEAVPIPPAAEEGPTGIPDGEEEEAPPEEAPVEPEALADILWESNVAVLNASGIAGLAGTATEKLVAGGFVNAWAGNADNSSTPANTVYYRDAGYHATAAKVAELLGIANLSENASAVGSGEIAVLLRTAP